ncbi:SRPBCC domain-containing protein [Streptomyces sp. NPDC002018]|uniref:SRPBCC domain-containing protein n=1 Tax=Streptomyces sp. NPDC002018 TaxID=3364629 RepID=UPI0036A8851F
MTATAETTRTVRVHQVYIRATPQAVWDAITQPEWNARYGYRCAGEFDLRAGGAYRVLSSDEMRQHGAPEQIIEGEIVEAVPPHRLVQTYRMLFTPELAGEPFTRLTYEIEEEPYGGVTKLTVTHDVSGAPAHAAQVAGEIKEAGGGWALLLSDLKSLLETGRPMVG